MEIYKIIILGIELIINIFNIFFKMAEQAVNVSVSEEFDSFEMITEADYWGYRADPTILESVVNSVFYTLDYALSFVVTVQKDDPNFLRLLEEAAMEDDDEEEVSKENMRIQTSR